MPSYTVRERRKPRTPSRPDGPTPPRYAERQPSALADQAPPRTTRRKPDSEPPGFSLAPCCTLLAAAALPLAATAAPLAPIPGARAIPCRQPDAGCGPPPAETEAGNRDFVLRFRLAGDQVLSGLMTYTRDAEHYFLLMAQPPRRVAPAQIMRREFLFVVDVSGSMNGFPLQTAGALMARLLAGLRPQETFNILFFSGASDALSPTPLAAPPENIRRAVAALNSRQGGGGTELGAALERAFAMPRTPDSRSAPSSCSASTAPPVPRPAWN